MRPERGNRSRKGNNPLEESKISQYDNDFRGSFRGSFRGDFLKD